MTLRLRLTLAYIGLLVPALVAFSVVVYFIASTRLYGALDDNIESRMEAVAAQLPRDRPILQSDVFANVSAIDGPPSTGYSVRILDRSGRVLYASPAARTRDIPDLGSFRPGSRFMTSETRGESLRIAYLPVQGADGSVLGYVQMATSLKPTDQALNELIGVFVVGGILVVIGTGLPAYVLAGRALRPVRQVSALAAELERTADFARRLPTDAPRGETAELVHTFNAMIDRVERVLASQKEFLAESSHELRRPLTVLRTYIDLLQEPELPELERATCIKSMREEAETMARLISDLLLLSREGEQSMQRGEVDLSGLCERLLARIREQDGRHRFVSETEPDIRIQGDGERIEQMVRNLLENAAQNTPADGEIALSLCNDAGLAKIEVRDSGRGIPPDEQAHIFERFFRGRDARASRSDGVGLGLAIVKHVAESHGGTVTFASTPGVGSRFTITLPVAKV
jgi:signal transduction histidine kinase